MMAVQNLYLCFFMAITDLSLQPQMLKFHADIDHKCTHKLYKKKCVKRLQIWLWGKILRLCLTTLTRRKYVLVDIMHKNRLLICIIINL
jgi:hypothetical protein